MDIHDGKTLDQSDRDLLKRVERGDEQAIASLYDRYSPLVYSIALRVLRDAALAEDVLQDIFMDLWNSPETFHYVEGSLCPALTIASRNRSIATLQKSRATDEIEPVLFAFSVITEGRLLVPALTAETACAGVVGLPVEQRRLLDMMFFEGMTPMEIASILHCPLETIKGQIRQALTLFRTLSSAIPKPSQPYLNENLGEPITERATNAIIGLA